MPAATTIAAIAIQRLLPVAVVESVNQGVDLADALARGGITVLEVTLRTDAGLAAIAEISSSRPEMVVGAGTVLTAKAAERAIAAGATFVVSPGLDAGIVQVCVTHGVAVLPGVCTPSEVLQALRLGLSVLKFFPAEQMGGVATLKALSSVFAEVRFVPTGGVTPANLAAYLALTNVAACGSSWLAETALLRAGDLDELERRARAACIQVEATR